MDPIDMAVRVLRRDGLIVYPTETVYGPGRTPSLKTRMKVYEAKNRPLSRPISIAVSDMDMLGAVAVLDEAARAFIERFLPGPVTVVLLAASCCRQSLPAALVLSASGGRTTRSRLRSSRGSTPDHRHQRERIG